MNKIKDDHSVVEIRKHKYTSVSFLLVKEAETRKIIRAIRGTH